MKATTLLSLAALSAPLFASADPVPGSQAAVTLALVGTESKMVTETATVEVSKLVSSRYGNRELLTDLLAEGILPDTTIAGWKLVVVDRQPLASQDNDLFVFYVVKAGKTPVELPASRLGIDVNSDTGVEARSQKLADGQTTASKSTFRAVVSFSGHQVLESQDDSYDDSFVLTAIAKGTSTWTVRQLKVETVSYPFTYDLLGPVKFSPIIGSLTDNLSQDDQKTPIEGSITFAASAAVDISGYPYTGDL